MKNLFSKSIYLILTCLITITAFHSGFSQIKGNGDVVIEERNVSEFTEIEVGGIFTVIVKQGLKQTVMLETDSNLSDKIKTDVIGGKLNISSTEIKSSTKLQIFIEVKNIESIESGGASLVKSEGVLKSDKLELLAGGASQINLTIETKDLKTTVSGSAIIILDGNAENNEIDISGVGFLNASKLITNITSGDLSGAGKAKVFANEEVNTIESGTSTLNLLNSPKTVNIIKSEPRKTETYYSTDVKREYTRPNRRRSYYSDTTKVKIGNLGFEVIEGDSTKITIGNNQLIVDDYGNVKFRKIRHNRFKGHWAGFELGVNGYVNSDLNMNFSKENEYFDLNMNKSIFVNINFFQQNVSLSKRNNVGFITGLGLGSYNYNFSKDVVLNSESSEIRGFKAEGISFRKSKLNITTLNFPLLFEFQNNSNYKRNSFHVSAGILFGIRITSHTKIYYEEKNKQFYLTEYDPITDKYKEVYQATSPNQKKGKVHDDFYLAPFKLDATFRIGYGWLNLFGTYSISKLFRENKGPELHPFTIGIQLVRW